MRACAEQLNAQARALRSSRTDIVGVTVPSLINSFFSTIISSSTGVPRLGALEEAWRAHGVEKREIYHDGYDQMDGHEGTLRLLDRRVEALLAGDSMMPEGALEACDTRQIAIGLGPGACVCSKS